MAKIAMARWEKDDVSKGERTASMSIVTLSRRSPRSTSASKWSPFVARPATRGSKELTTVPNVDAPARASIPENTKRKRTPRTCAKINGVVAEN